MLSFNEYNDQQNLESLIEALITFGGKAYPKFNNVVIMAGGAGSGKGFVLNKLVGMEGKVFDVDALKGLALRAPLIKKRVKRQMDIDLDKLNLTNPDDVSMLHSIMADVGVTKRREVAMFNTIFNSAPDRKPNLIFDVTLKDLDKLAKITSNVSELGYPKENIHIVWVVNDVEVAKKQNKNPDRGRVVPTEILINTHRGVSATMHDIISMGSKVKKYMDGDIVFAFNKVGVDSEVIDSNIDNSKKRGRDFVIQTKEKMKSKGFVVDKANYVYVKRRGRRPLSLKSFDKSMRQKLRQYVPKGVNW